MYDTETKSLAARLAGLVLAAVISSLVLVAAVAPTLSDDRQTGARIRPAA